MIEINHGLPDRIRLIVLVRQDPGMLVHKLNRPAIGALLAISVATATATVIWTRHTATYPVGIRGDRLDIAPQDGCSQMVWPYGCDWQHQNTLPNTRIHSRFGHRGRQRGQKRFLS